MVAEAIADAGASANAVVRFGGGRELIYAVTTSSAAITIDLNNGNTQTVTLAHNVTVTLSGATVSTSCTISLYLVQDAVGGRTVTWPASVKWPGGTAPTLSTTALARDLVVLETLDGGTTWFANLGGLGYA